MAVNETLPTSLLSGVAVFALLALIFFENFLPDLNYNKAKLLTLACQELSSKNMAASPPNNDHYIYMDESEKKLLAWFTRNFNLAKLEEQKIALRFDDYFAAQVSMLNATYYNICVQHLNESALVKDIEKYQGFIDFKGAAKMFQNTIPVGCRIITGGLSHILESHELGQYFSILLLQGLDTFVSSVVFNPATMGGAAKSKLLTSGSNYFLKMFMEANLNIATSFYDRLLVYKSTILYTPKDCFPENVDFKSALFQLSCFTAALLFRL